MPKIVVKNLLKIPQQVVLSDHSNQMHTRVIAARGELIVDEESLTPEVMRRAVDGSKKSLNLSPYR